MAGFVETSPGQPLPVVLASPPQALTKQKLGHPIQPLQEGTLAGTWGPTCIST